MTRSEFLNILQMTLEGEVSQSIIEDNIAYYSRYIDDEIRNGKTEAEVLNQLGEPRLIARTIIDTSQVSQGANTYHYSNERPGRDEYERDGFDGKYDRQPGYGGGFSHIRLNSWYGRLLLIFILIFILFIVGQVMAFLLPLVLPVLVIFFIISIFTGNRR